MIIELQRAFSPEELRPDFCGVCGEAFMVQSVLANAATDALGDMGYACPRCVAVLGGISPEQCAPIEAYVEALQRYPEPMCATGEEAGERDSHGDLNAESWIWESVKVREMNGRR